MDQKALAAFDLAQKNNSQINDLSTKKAEKTYVDAELGKKANQSDLTGKRDKNALITMTDIAQDVKTAMTGGSVPVVGVGAVGNENLKMNAVDLSKLSSEFKKTTPISELDLSTGYASIYDNFTGNRLVITNIPITKKGRVSLKIKSKAGNVTVVLLVNTSGDNFYVKDQKTVTLTEGINDIGTGFLTDGTGNEYIGISAPSQVLYFGAGAFTYRMANTFTLDGTSFTTNPSSTATFGFYPIVEQFKVSAESVSEAALEDKSVTNRAIQYDAVSIDNLTSDLKELVPVKPLDVSAGYSTFYASNTGKVIIQNIPLDKEGFVTLNINSAAKDVDLLLLEKDADNFTIKNKKRFSLTSGINKIKTGFYSTGQGNQYVGFFQHSSTASIAYKSGSSVTYLQTDVAVTGNIGDVIVPTLKTNATFGIQPTVLKLKVESTGSTSIQWKNKKGNFLGDSITAGDITGNGTIGIPWVSYMQELTGLSAARNYGAGGSRLSGNNDYCMVRRYLTMDNDADLIGVWGGINDFVNNAPLGTIGVDNEKDFYGSLEILTKGLVTKYPTATIFFMTPMKSTKNFPTMTNDLGLTIKDYRDAIIKVCDKYSIPVLDMYSLGGISPLFPEHVTNLMPDALHPNNAGYRKLSYKIGSFINAL